MVYREHKKEIYSVDWSKVPYEQLFISASWDSTVKIWDPIRNHSLSTYIGHTQLVYNAVFASHIPNTFASVSGDGMLKIWDILCYDLPIASIKAHEGEVVIGNYAAKSAVCYKSVLCVSGPNCRLVQTRL